MLAKAYLLLPCAAGILYTVSQFWLKRALDLGVGPWRSAFVANWLSCLVFVPMAFVWPDGPYWGGWGPAVAASAALFAGQLLAFWAIERGDVSVVAPMMGTKVLGVVVLSVLLFHQGFGWDVWFAALLTTVAIAMLQWGPPHDRRRILRTVLFSGAAALSFALCDVVIQRWCRDAGFFVFGAKLYLLCGLFSFGLMPFFHRPLREMPRDALPWLAMGVVFLCLQGFCMYAAIGYFRDAAGSNIVYNLRGVWSIVLIWFAGRQFRTTEGEVGPAVLARRFIGAALMVASVALILV
ncbi:MAG TPA: EamA family transporter [Verrucomicrobiae bacterium]|nr:EamA family transporter [Verrucomicrobiae bacterium]